MNDCDGEIFLMKWSGIVELSNISTKNTNVSVSEKYTMCTYFIVGPLFCGK
jgi:hypothetical protein